MRLRLINREHKEYLGNDCMVREVKECASDLKEDMTDTKHRCEVYGISLSLVKL